MAGSQGPACKLSRAVVGGLRSSQATGLGPSIIVGTENLPTGLHTIWQLACSRVGHEGQRVGAGKGKEREAKVLRPNLRSDIHLFRHVLTQGEGTTTGDRLRGLPPSPLRNAHGCVLPSNLRPQRLTKPPSAVFPSKRTQDSYPRVLHFALMALFLLQPGTVCLSSLNVNDFDIVEVVSRTSLCVGLSAVS